ncbi:Ig-like domain-containing protein [Sphingobacterium pedocola]|uniref:Ig-like domain-containing protein n=1 Tax=Sphingobacterium pedocola TaxID=2082722 RepID=A0ABR9T5R8_9SPHI|nr:gliding motility-associated C-terminal domain-containing protein [Sphingobacterium pedocola]MBE8720683.1 hypothetical protein [Sphingobacterium pedocola]
MKNINTVDLQPGTLSPVRYVLLFILLILGITSYGQTKEYATVTPSSGAIAVGLLGTGSSGVDNAGNAANSSEANFATITSTRIVAGLLGSGDGWLQLKFENNLQPNDWVYIRYSGINQTGLTLGLGSLLGAPSNFIQATLYKNATANAGSSGHGTALGGSTNVKFVTGNDGLTYIAVQSPGNAEAFNSVRIRLTFGSDVNVAAARTIDIHYAYALSNIPDCAPVAFAGDGEASGVGLNLGSLLGASNRIVENPSYVIDNNTSNYSVLKSSLLSVAGTFSQSFYFPSSSEANSVLKVRLQLSSAIANVSLLGGYYIRAYNGTNPTPVLNQQIQGGLINGLDLLGALNSGGILTVPLNVGQPFDRVEVVLENTLGVSIGADLRIYGVTRSSGPCPEPPPTANPLFDPMCANTTVVSSLNADDPQFATDDNFDSYATIRSDAGILVGLGSRAGHLEVNFPSEVPAGKTTYIRIDYDEDVLNSLLAGSLGDVVGGLVNGLVLGNHFFEVQLKNGAAENLNTSSANLFSSSNGQVKIVQDKAGRFYIAVKADQPFTNIRLTDRTTSVVGLLSADKYLNVYNVCYDASDEICDPAFSTSYEGSGITLGVLQLGKTGVVNPERAIDDDENTFSEINLGLLSVAGSMSQYIHFNSLSDAQSVFKIKLAVKASQTLNVDLLGAYEIIAYNGNTEVYHRSLGGGLLNGTNVLGLLETGNPGILTFAPGKAFDRIEIRVNSLLNVSAFESVVEVYDVKRFGPTGSGCEDPDFVLPTATPTPFEIPSCEATVVAWEHADYAYLAADGNNESFATLTASSGTLLGMGAYSGFLEYEFPTVIPANKTTYVRIDMEDNLLPRLLSGTLGNLVNTVGGLLLGDHYFSIEAKTAQTGGTTVLAGSSQAAFVDVTGGDLRIVQDNIGRYYIAITPNADYKNIRITEHFPSLVGLTQDVASMKIFEACMEIGTDNCLPGQFTSFDQSGLSLGLLNGAGVQNADHAISLNSSDYSEISTGTVAVAAQVSQRIYFNKLSAAGDTLNVRLQLDPSSLATVDLLGSYSIVTYNGSVIGETFTLQDGLINNLNLLDLFSSGGVQTLTFQTNTPYDRVDVVAGSLLNVAVTPSIRLYEVKRIGAGCPTTTTPSPFENPVCVTTIRASSNADNIANLFDDDFDSYATLNSGSNSLLGQLLGGQPNNYTGFVELGFDTPVDANKTAYVRIDFEPTLLNKLLGGSLGGAVADLVDGLLLGNHYFNIQAKDGNAIVLQGGSNNNFGGNNDRIRIVQDKLGRYYIAITPTAQFDAIRITNGTNTALPLTAQGNSMNVYGACVDNPLTDCQPVFTTSYDASGLNLTAAGLAGSGAGVDNADHAINDNTTDYSEISLGTLAVGQSVRQYFDFRKSALPSEVVNLTLRYGSGALDANLIGGLEIIAYNGATPVATLDVQSQLINGLNVLGILNNGTTGVIPFAPGVEYDKISIGLKGVLNVSVLPALRVFAVEKDCNTPLFDAWKSYKETTSGTAVADVKGGEEIEYTIHIANTGAVALTNYRVVDTIPEYTTYVAGSGGVLVADSVVFENVTIAVGDTARVSFKVTVNADLTGATSISNVAFVKENENDPGTGTVPPADPTDPTAGPDENVPPGTPTDIPVDPISTVSTWKGFGIANGTSTTSVSGGETVTYTIYIKNTGNQALTGVSISDALPIGTTYVSGGTLNGTSVDFAGIDIPVGGTESRSFEVLVKDNLTGVTQISNVAVVIAVGTSTSTAPADPTDPTAGPAPGTNPGDPTLIPVNPTDNVVAWKGYSIANGTSTTTVSGGEDVTYTIYIKNESNQDLTGLSVSDAIPAGTTYVSGGTLNGNTVEFTDIDVAFGQTVLVSFVVKVDVDLTSIDAISNVALIKTDPSDPGTPTVPPADPTDPVAGPDPVATPGDPTDIPVTANHSIDLSLAGVSNGTNSGQAQANDVITYTVTITNTGNKDLTNVQLVDAIPANTTLLDAGDFTQNGANVELTIPTLAVGETQTFTFTVTVDAIDPNLVTSIDNSVTASNAEVSETATHTILTNCTPVVAANLDLTSSVSQLCAGEPVTLNAAIAGAPGVTANMIKWYSAYNSGTGALSGYLDEGTSLLLTPTQTGALTYYAVIEGTGFCFNNPPAQVVVTVNELPITPTINADVSTVCEGESVTLTATAGADGYKWYRGADLLTETSNTLTIASATLSDAGQYTVIAVNVANCESAVSAPVTIGVTPRATAADVAVTGNDPVCEGSAVTLTASSTLTNPIFYWYDNASATTPAFTGPSLNLVPNATLTYYVAVSGDGVCENAIADRVPVTVTVNPAPVIVFNEASSYAIEINESVAVPTYDTEAGVTYQWKDQSGADFNGTTFGPFASPGTHVYTLIATNTLSGCQTAANVTIRVFNPGECPPVYTRVYGNDASQYDVTKLLFINLGEVDNPTQAADQNVATFSTLTEVANVAGLLGQTYQNIKWTGSPIAAGTPVTVKLGKTLTVAQLAGGIRVQPINAAGNPVGVSHLVDGDLVNIVAGENIFDFTFVPTNASGQQVPYSGVKVYLSALATVAQSVNLYEAYYHTPGTPDCDDPNGVVDVLSGLERPIGGVGALNGLVNVIDAANAVDGNDGTFAVLNNAVGVNAYTRLEVLYSTPALAGDTLSIRVGKPSSLLTVGLLESFTIQPYLGNTAVGAPIHNDGTLLKITLLAGNEQADVKFIANAPFDRVKILYGGVASVLDQLQVHEITRTIPAVVAGPNGDNKFEICPGGDITIPVPDNCTTYIIYDAPTGGNVVNVTELLEGTHTLYVQTVRFGTCETGERTPIDVIVNELPAISSQPQSVTVDAGTTATFTVALSNAALPVTYQWQTSIDGGATWLDVAGATTASLDVVVPATQTEGVFGSYRVLVTSDAGCIVESAPAVLNVVKDYGFDDDAITKVGDAPTATAGTSYSYTVTVENKGPSVIQAGTALFLQDVVSSGQTVTGITSTGGTLGVIGTAGEFTFTPTAAIAVNGTFSLTVTVDVDAAITADIINNTIKIWSTDPAGDYTTPEGTAMSPDIPVERDYGWGDPDAVEKTGDAATATAGEAYSYTVTLTNKGTSTILPATTLYLQDAVSAGQVISGITSSNGTVGTVAADGSFTLDVATAVAPESTITLTVTVDVDAAITADIINNTIKIWSTDPAGDYTTPEGTATTPDIPVERDYGFDDDAVAKVGDAPTATAGTSYSYTVTVENKGPSVIQAGTALFLQDVVSSGQTVTGITSTGGTLGAIGTAGEFTFTPTAAIAVNGTFSLTVTVDVDAAITADIINNTIKIWSTDPAGDYTTPEGTAVTPDIPVERDYGWGDPDAVEKTGDAATATAGEAYSYTVTLTNKGTSTILPATTLYLQDAVSAGQVISGITSSNGTVGTVAADGSFTLDVATAVAPESTITLTVTVDVDAAITADIINNTINIWSEDPAGDYTTPEGTATTPDIDVNRVSNFSVSKTTTATVAIAGESVDFKVVLTNNGPSTAKTGHKVIITEKPDGLIIAGGDITVTSGNATFDGVYDAATGVFTIEVSNEVNVGGTIELNVTGHVPANATGTVKNGIEVDGDDDETPPIPVEDKVAFGVVKTTTATVAIAGESVDFKVVLTNNGPSTAKTGHKVIITEKPDGLIIAGGDITVTSGNATFDGVYDAATGVFTIEVSNEVNVGGTIELNVTGHVPANATGTVKNGIEVDGDDDETPPIPVEDKVAFGVVKTTTATVAIAGESVDFKVVLTNNGPSTAKTGHKVIITEKPDGLIIAGGDITVTSGNATFDGVYDAATGVFTIEVSNEVNVGGTIELNVTGHVPANATGTVKNGIEVDGDDDETPPIPVEDKVAFGVVKTTTATVAIAGESVDFKVVLTNNGPSTAKTGHKVIITEKPDGLIIAGGDITVTSGNATFDGVYDAATGVFTIEVSNEVNVGGTIELNITGHVPANATGTVKNGIEVDGDDDETPPIPVDNESNLSITKVADQARVTAGTNTTFTVTITNNGPSDIASGKLINLGEIPSEGLAITGYEVTSGNGAAVGTGNTATVTTNANVAVGGMIIVKVTALVEADAPATISNAIKVWGPDKPTTEEPDDEDGTPEIPVDRESALSITKVADEAVVKAGESTTFTVTITNNGPSDIASGKVINLGEMPSAGLTITKYEVTSGNGEAVGTGNTATVTTSAVVAVGGTITVTVTADVDEEAPATITNGIKVWGPDKPTTEDPDDEDETPEIPVEFPLIEAVDDFAEVKAGHMVEIPVTANDIVTEWDIDLSTVEIVQGPSRGSVVVLPTGEIEFTAPSDGNLDPVTFTYRVKDEKGRYSNVATVTVTILPNPLEIPNVITPNGDGYNDRFVIKGLEGYDKVSLSIINRWGNEIYFNENYDNTWGGLGLNDGTYYYVLQLVKDGKKESHKGWVLIKSK